MTWTRGEPRINNGLYKCSLKATCRIRSPHLSPSPARIRSTIASVVDQPDDLRQMRLFHKALADVNRLRIVQRLADGPATVTELIDHVGLSQPLVSWHLGKLRAVGHRHDQPARPRDDLQPATRGLHRGRRARARAPGRGRPADDQRPSDEHRASASASRVRHLGEPIALFFGRLGLTPNGLTLIGFAITVVGARPGRGRPVAGWPAFVVFIGGAFDMFDGALARATGKASKLGAFLDSIFDRWGEVDRLHRDRDRLPERPASASGAGLAAVAMSAAFLVSYTRAQAESLGLSTGRGMAAVGLAPREVRLVILSLGL